MKFIWLLLVAALAGLISGAEGEVEELEQYEKDLDLLIGASSTKVTSKTCAPNRKLVKGKCIAKKTICLAGQKYDKQRKQCVKLCRKGEMYIRKTKSCQKRCARGERYNLKTEKCEKNPCPQGQVLKGKACRCIRTTKTGKKKNPNCDSKEKETEEDEDYLMKETEEEDETENDSGLDDADYGDDYEGNDEENTSDEDYEELVNDEDRKRLIEGVTSLEEELGTVDINNAFVYYPTIKRSSKKKTLETRIKYNQHWFYPTREEFYQNRFGIQIFSDRYYGMETNKFEVMLTSKVGYHLRPEITMFSSSGKTYPFGELNFMNPQYRCQQKIDLWRGPTTTCIRPRDFFHIAGGNENLKTRLCFEVFFPLYEFGLLLCYGVDLDRPSYKKDGIEQNIVGNEEMLFTVYNGGEHFQTDIIKNNKKVTESVLERFMKYI